MGRYCSGGLLDTIERCYSLAWLPRVRFYGFVNRLRHRDSAAMCSMEILSEKALISTHCPVRSRSVTQLRTRVEIPEALEEESESNVPRERLCISGRSHQANVRRLINMFRVLKSFFARSEPKPVGKATVVESHPPSTVKRYQRSLKVAPSFELLRREHLTS